MITRTLAGVERRDWKIELKQAYTTPENLLRDLGIDASRVTLTERSSFAFRVPRPFAAKMIRGDSADPLLRQVLPYAEEEQISEHFSADPNSETEFTKTDGLLQKYRGRALLIMTGGCAINCRYCFRRNFPYADAVGSKRLSMALQQLKSDISITEIILSGGDPLLLDDDQIGELLDQIEAIPQIARLRIHTRLPVTIPTRITDSLVQRLSDRRFDCVIVFHANHANEIDQELEFGCERLRREGITLLNQSVLLDRVNADAHVLANLSETLFSAGILPYYVHLLDPVHGAAHFDVNADRAANIERELQALLPGYLVPKFVKEIPGQAAKTPLHEFSATTLSMRA